jgi:hypothetical protein
MQTNNIKALTQYKMEDNIKKLIAAVLDKTS